MNKKSLKDIKKFLSRDVKEFNKYSLSFVCIAILLGAGILSYLVTNSYALFTHEIFGKESINLSVAVPLDTSGANAPKLSENMIPVYYDETDDVWRKADKNNFDKEHQWYDYDKKMWANAVTYDYTKVRDMSDNSKGYVFNGTSDYMNLKNESYDFGNKLTIAARFKSDNADTSYYKIISNTENGGFSMTLNNKKIQIMIYSSSESAYKYLYSDVLETDKWHTAVVTYDGSNIILYIDGQEQDKIAFTENITVSAAPIFIGAEPTSTGTIDGDYFNGVISDALVLKDSLSASEITSNYSDEFNYETNANEVIYKKYGNKNSGEIINASYIKDGVSFDGTGDYIIAKNTSNYNFGNEFTAGARFKTTKFGTAMGTALIDNYRSAGFEFFVSKEGKIKFQFWTAEDGTKVELATDETINLNQWYTAVVTYDGSTLKLYVDGTLKKSYEVTANIKVSPQNIHLGINGYLNKNSAFTGVISDAFVINDVLTENAISANYNANTFNHQENINTLFYYKLTEHKEYEKMSNGTEIPMEDITTMLVWIPRFKYKVWNYNLDGTVTSSPQEIEITFENEGDSTGEIECADSISNIADSVSEICKLKSSNTTCTDSLCNEKTYTHPAFTLGSQALKGFWAGKFEVSSDSECNAKNYNAIGEGCNLTTIKPITKPNVENWTGAMISVYQNNMMAMNDKGNIYGFSTTDDTHMIKNIEWGAIAYLSHSKYGKNGQVYMNSNNKLITGCGPQTDGSTSAGTICNTYDTDLGKSASTTGNIYGVYDMVGGTSEYTMANIVSPDGITMVSGYSNTQNEHSGYNGVVFDSGNYTAAAGTYDYPNAKYYDKYSFSKLSNGVHRNKLGDATKETINTSTYSWYATARNVYLGVSSASWFPRGGAYNSGAGGTIFSGGNTSGAAFTNRTTRLIVS